jgi:hypothetical protein
MISAEKKRQFVKLRAAGLSYEKIHKKLGIAKDTCSRWKKELAAQIDEAKAQELKSLSESFNNTRIARVKAIGEILKKLDQAIEDADFSKVPADRLLSVRLQYVDALNREIIIPRPDMKAATMEEILASYVELMNETRKGNVSTEQASKENSILIGLLKAVETSKLKAQIEEIRAMLAKK